MPKGDREILKADPEDGTTPVANLLLEAMAIAKLTGREKGILLLLCRKTYGWQQNGHRCKETALSVRNCAKALSIDPRTAQKLLGKLIEDMILLREFSRPGYGYTYQINTRVGEWNTRRINHQLLEKLSGDGMMKNSTVGMIKKPTPHEANLTTRKENNNKRLKKDLSTDKEENKNENKNAQVIWEAALNEIKSQVSNSNYRTWFQNTIAISYEANQFVIGVPNNFTAEYLSKNQQSLIEKALIGLTSPDVQVNFQINNESSKLKGVVDE